MRAIRSRGLACVLATASVVVILGGVAVAAGQWGETGDRDPIRLTSGSGFLDLDAFSDLELVETEEDAVERGVEALTADAERVRLEYVGVCGDSPLTVAEICSQRREEVEDGVVWLVGHPRRFDLALLVAHELVHFPGGSYLGGMTNTGLFSRYRVADGYVRSGEAGDLDPPWGVMMATLQAIHPDSVLRRTALNIALGGQ